ncbi:uncharacterized protein PHALS_15160 [Plasmopara halstedii]|uniref:Uncharacterized protein n=1 Tax=Plasmopara halstedii TaxID=4781 RepID=A0A0P1B4I2_PLAHL|nr:uncharacterized protein PHALS_15160 [Plasmopara halstedii]CEG48601.1 hypothetical protein PHALS_15160 [Plasmopara halstedii]|eukprot:XP_024584970.1 hypothetical protein PHALS_15160 [Plasmopara halstedii]
MLNYLTLSSGDVNLCGNQYCGHHHFVDVISKVTLMGRRSAHCNGELALKYFVSLNVSGQALLGSAATLLPDDESKLEESSMSKVFVYIKHGL